MNEPILIFNPAFRPGVEPLRTPLRGDASRGILWDRPVKLVPEPTATDLVQYSGCHRCAWPEAVMDTFGLKREEVKGLIEDGHLSTAEYDPAKGTDEERQSAAAKAGKTVRVVVLDTPTRRRLRAAAEEARKAAAAAAKKASKATKSKKGDD